MMKNPQANRRRKKLMSEKGIATLEVLPLLLVFVFLIAYTLGAFGIIHTGIMSSISARAYAFEIFRNRTDLTYFRDRAGTDKHFRNIGSRAHGIMTEAGLRNGGDITAIERPIRVGIAMEPGPSRNDPTLHNERVHSDQVADGRRNQQVEVSPAWIMIQYGICIDARCGG